MIALLGGHVRANDHPAPGTLVCVGDSITRAGGAVEGKGYAELLQARATREHLALKVLKDGRSGWTTGAFVKAATQPIKIPPADATTITIMLGMNDSHSLGAAEPIAARAVANIDKLVSAYKAKAPGAAIVLLSPTAVDVAKLSPYLLKAKYGPNSVAILKAITAAFRDEAAKRGWRFIDLSNLPSAGHTVDGVHPDAEGHAELADAIWAALSAPAPATRP